MVDFECPDDLRYTSEHGWVRCARADGTEQVRIGITAYAEGALGDIVYVAMPQVGERVEAGAACGELESTTTVSDLYAPLSGVVTQRNESLEGSPELVNSDPYGDGWVLDVRPDDPGRVGALLDAAAYRRHVRGGRPST